MADHLQPTTEQAIEDGRQYLLKTMQHVGRLAYASLQNVTAEEIAEDMRANQKDAPLRAHFVAKAFVAQVRIDAQHMPTQHNNLNVTIIQQAKDNAEWLKMAEPHQRGALPAKPAKVVDVKAAEKVPVAK